AFLYDAGFKLVKEEITFLRYESPRVFINVYQGRASYEVGIEFGRIGLSDGLLRLTDVVAWAGAEKREGFGNCALFQASSRASVEEVVPKVAALVRKYASALLRGDDAAFDSALQIQSDRMEDYERGVILRNI